MSPFGAVRPLDNLAAAESARRRALLPPGALGTFGPALDLLAGARGGPVAAIAPDRVALVVFAGDHGIAFAGVTAYPPGTTARRINELGAGTGPVAQLAAEAGVQVRAVDIAVRGEITAPNVDRSHRVRTASGRIDMQDALSEDFLDQALQAGIELADAEVDGGADILIGAVCGAAVSTPTAALVSVVTGMEPVDATTRGSGIDDPSWIAKCAAVRDARFRARDHGGDARALLRIAGGADLAALTGFIAQAAVRRTPVLVDDVPSLLCAVLANRLAPGTDRYLIAADTTSERTGARLHQLLGLTPLADHAMTLGSGSGAMMSVPALRIAAHLADEAARYNETIERAGNAIAAWDQGLL